MIDVYSQIFANIFKQCSIYLNRDFASISSRNEYNDKNIQYCLSSCKKVFEETIKKFDKSKYNGDIVLPDKIASDYKNIFSTNTTIVENSLCFQKKKIIINNDNTIKLANAREAGKNMRILLIPIDGFASFSRGIADYSIVLVLYEKKSIVSNDDKNFSLNDKKQNRQSNANIKNDEKNNYFTIKNVSVFNVISDNIVTFDETNKCKLNEKKIANDNLSLRDVNTINSIFVTNNSQRIDFNLTKLAQISTFCCTSNSIFNSIVRLLTTQINLCVYHIDTELTSIIEFVANTSLLKTKKIGNHLIIGREEIVSHIFK